MKKNFTLLFVLFLFTFWDLSIIGQTLDYGDAPDPTYPTLLASSGARHTATGPRLGSLRDAEANGQPNASATGDDINPPTLDDEDGIWWPFNFVPGHGNTIRVTVSGGTAYLSAWMDFNIDGDWADAGEKIFTNQLLTTGTTDLSMVVPSWANYGNTFARFRLSTVQNLNYTGAAANGEVEDHQVVIQPAESMEYGDAPDPTYPTLAASNGARHAIQGGNIFMGASADYELDGQPDINATGDDLNPIGGMDDEDGVVLNTPLLPGFPATVTITVSITGPLLQGWVDFNADGDFIDAGEQIITNINPPGLISAYNFNVPAGATLGPTFARFRFSTMPNIASFGAAPNGEVEDYKYYIGEQEQLDYGDADDPNYPTLFANDGARHAVTGLYMGVLVDTEADGQPNGMATGDDLNPFGFDDEDGIWWPGDFVPGQANTVKVSTTGAGFLNGWFDFDLNGSWAEFGEQIFNNVALNAGSTDLTVNVPATAIIGPTFMRYRFSSQQNLSYTGMAQDGEVEDYQIQVQPPALMDYGDAPDLNYQTLAVNNGARHAMGPPPGVFMGALVDYEIDDNNPPGANNDEDGVVFNTPLFPGAPAQVTITVSITGAAIQGWIDFNADGDFLDLNEQIITNFVAFNLINAINFNVPAGAITGATFARFRYSTMGNLSPYGSAPNGEVEDYQVSIISLITDTPVDPDPNGLYTQNEISMALLPGVQPGIPAVLLAAYNDEPYPGGPGLGIVYSFDGGATWNNTHLTYPPDPYGGGNFVDQFDPTATADANGNIIVGHISTDYDWVNGPASGLYVEISSDGGATWSGPIAVCTDGPPVGNPDPNYRFNDRCQITSDINPSSLFYNNLYIVEIKDRGWNNPLLQSDIYFSASTDGGLTWSPQVILNGAQSSLANMPVPAVAPDGTIYVCWMDYNVQTGGIGNIYMDISTDGGLSWLANDIFVRAVNLPPIRLNGGTDNLTKGAAVLGVSPFNSQEIYLTYAEQNMIVMDEADIYFIKSTDGGLTWTVPLRVNDDFTVTDQVLPWMDVKSNGIIDIAWYDRRNDPADLKWDVYIAMSTDGGNSFGANQIITNINSSTPNTPSGLWMGEYLGLVTDNSYAYLAFCQALTDVKGDIYFDKIQNPATNEIDFGDAIDPSYPTLLANDGARHVMDGITFLGASVDPDGDGQPDPNALGDDNDEADDEDGITFDWALDQGNPCKLTAVASVAGGFLNGWIDFDLNGSWAEAGEQVFTDVPLAAGSNDLTFIVPLNAGIGWTFARFRFSTQAGLGYSGLASTGEVEDYYVEITEDPDNKWIQPPETSLPGIHAHDYINAFGIHEKHVVADDWLCNGGYVTDIHWWGNYELDALQQERRGAGINHFHLSIHNDDPTGLCLPVNPEIWGIDVPFSSITEQFTGLFNNEGSKIYLYEYVLTAPFDQIAGTRYWLDLIAISVDPANPPQWRWQEASRSQTAILCGAASETLPQPGNWFTIVWNNFTPPRYSDMAFIITSTEFEQLDFGDLPDLPYPTLLASNGPSHTIGTLFLGNQIDAEPNGLPHPSALGDDNNNLDDEDGVVFPPFMQPGQVVSITVTASLGTGLLQGWLDMNADGDFNDLGEQIFQNFPLPAGSSLVSFNVNAGAKLGATFARFRLSTVNNLGYTGPAPDGEVEDYKVYIVNPEGGKMHWGQLPDLNPTGMDVDITWVPTADDWLCTETGLINKIRMWVSFADDILPDPLNKDTVRLQIYSDIPAGNVQPWSMPGDLLWSRTYYAGEYTATIVSNNSPEWWYDPATQWWQPNNHQIVVRFDFDLGTEPFEQLVGTIYWLEAKYVYKEPPVLDNTLGWKTTQYDLRFNDDAVWWNATNPNFPMGWVAHVYPGDPQPHPWAGQTFDMAFVLNPPEEPDEIDFGDLPDLPYPTTLASNGARHLVGGLYLGNQIDAEADGLPHPSALGDDNNNLDDEDGVILPAFLIPGQVVTASVVASLGNCYLQGWIDENIDGDFNDPGEQIFFDQLLNAGSNSPTFTVNPGAKAGATFARFRVSTLMGLGYSGPAPDGEVEDYKVYIVDPQETKMHYPQPPDLNPTGMDVDLFWTPTADDFMCTESGPITHIRTWMSFADDIIPTPLNLDTLLLIIHSDIPAGIQQPWSMPGNVLWNKIYYSGEYSAKEVADDKPEWWYDPATQWWQPNNHTHVFRFDFTIDDNQFIQEAGTIYWLEIRWIKTDPVFPPPPPDPRANTLGWKTTTLDTRFNDDAVWWNNNNPNFPIGWVAHVYPGYPEPHPYAGLSFDMSFIINPPPEIEELDFGDLPDGPYPTLLVNNGPRHVVGPLYLGNQIDGEVDGQPDPGALGDDNANLDDEDGVAFVGGLFPGEITYVSVKASQGNGLLQGWIDFNSDGDFNDAGEQIFLNVPLIAAGVQMLSFTTDPNALPGTTFARFRLSTVSNLGYTGGAPDGEVEDYEVIIRHPVAIWHLDENFGNIAYDATAYDNDGSVSGATWIPGYSNSALSFNGFSDYVTVQHSPSLDITGPFTTQAWIKCSGYQWYYAIVDKLEYTPAGSRGFTMYLTGGQLRLSVYSGASGNGDVFGTTDLRDNTWHHVFASWDGTKMRAFVDGILEGEIAWTFAPESTTQNVGIGMRLSGWGSYMPFDGIIDEVIISAAAPPEFDFGDAADPTYPTLYANDGARHIPDGITYLGFSVDPDNNGQPHPNALGDDLDENDDEDGVTVIFPLTPGGTGGFDVAASAPGYLNAWIDYNADGSWDDSGEQVFTDQMLFAGSNWLLFFVPGNAYVGQTYARFRFSTATGLSYTGMAPDGEVEDHEINIEGELDFGDAPDFPYPTLLVNDGARHLVVPGVFLGTNIDAEPDGLQNPNALGDDNNNLDDEDGVLLPALIAKGQQNIVTVTASVNGVLNAWIDFNLDGFWGSDISEQIFTNQAITAGTNTLTFNAPFAALSGTSFARFRFNTTGGLSFTGYAPDGEVEDYQVEIGEPYKWSQQPDLTPNGMDVDATLNMGMPLPPCVLADDFLCDRTGPLTKINVWGSWMNDIMPDGPMSVSFVLAIHSDIPADQSPTGYSMPGNVLWSQTFMPGQFQVMLYMPGLMEGWYSPQLGFFTPFGDTQCWLYTFDLIQQFEPFVQHGNPDEPVIYWLSIQATPMSMDPNVRFGWKTSVDQWNDNATWAVGVAPYNGVWSELYHPMTMLPLDLAFEIYGLESQYFYTNLHAYIEGPYNGSTMNTDLNIAGLIPLSQPYDSDPLAKWYYTGKEQVPVIPNASVVDWILVELRDAPSAPMATGATMIAQRAAFILGDGSIVATDGGSMIKFYVTFTFNPYLVIWHRNHLGVLSANPMTPVAPGIYSYDFSTGVGQAYGGALGHKNLGGGTYGMFGGDGVPNGLINNPDKTNVWTPNVGTSGYKAGDYNLDSQVNNPDKNDIWVPNLGQGTQVPN
jgi:hypothetical protein